VEGGFYVGGAPVALRRRLRLLLPGRRCCCGTRSAR
jgi:hypothetical protein